jgi:hypothetical protein
MSTVEATELTDVLNRVSTWPTTLRITLARKILESLDEGKVLAPGSPPTRKTRGLSAAEVRTLLNADRPAPDDETVNRWIDEQRMEKYG